MNIAQRLRAATVTVPALYSNDGFSAKIHFTNQLITNNNAQR